MRRVRRIFLFAVLLHFPLLSPTSDMVMPMDPLMGQGFEAAQAFSFLGNGVPPHLLNSGQKSWLAAMQFAKSFCDMVVKEHSYAGLEDRTGAAALNKDELMGFGAGSVAAHLVGDLRTSINAACDKLENAPEYRELQKEFKDWVPTVPVLKRTLFSLMLSWHVAKTFVFDSGVMLSIESQVREVTGRRNPIFESAQGWFFDEVVLKNLGPALAYWALTKHEFIGLDEKGKSAYKFRGRTKVDLADTHAWRRAVLVATRRFTEILEDIVTDRFIGAIGVSRLNKIRGASAGLIDPELPSFIHDWLFTTGVAALCDASPKEEGGDEKNWLRKNVAAITRDDARVLRHMQVVGANRVCRKDPQLAGNIATMMALKYGIEKMSTYSIEKTLEAIAPAVTKGIDAAIFALGKVAAKIGIISRKKLQNLAKRARKKRDGIREGVVFGSQMFNAYCARISQFNRPMVTGIRTLLSDMLGDPMLLYAPLGPESSNRVFARSISRWVLNISKVFEDKREWKKPWREKVFAWDTFGRSMHLIAMGALWYLFHSGRDVERGVVSQRRLPF